MLSSVFAVPAVHRSELGCAHFSRKFYYPNLTIVSMCPADVSSGVAYGPRYSKTWLPKGLPNIINADILQHQEPENEAAKDPKACSRLYDKTLDIIMKRVREVESEQRAQKIALKTSAQ